MDLTVSDYTRFLPNQYPELGFDNYDDLVVEIRWTNVYDSIHDEVPETDSLIAPNESNYIPDNLAGPQHCDSTQMDVATGHVRTSFKSVQK